MRPGPLWLLGMVSLVAPSCLDVADLDSGRTDASVDAAVDAGAAGLELLPAKPPERPAGAQKPSGQGAMRWFAARRVFSGTVSPLTLERDLAAWKDLGHDIDGECTTEEQSTADTSGVCKKPANADEASLEDGHECRDNGYGKIFSHVAEKLKSTWEQNFQADVANGATTILLRLSDLDDGPDDPFVPGAVYLSAPRKFAPAWDGNDVYQIRTSSVEGTKVSDPPRVSFPSGYLKDDVWVSNELGTGPGLFPVFLLKAVLMTDLLTRTLVVKLDPTHEHALGSAFSAVVARSAILDDLSPFFLEMVGCDEALSNMLVQMYLLPSADLGTQAPAFHSPASACQGTSIGGAFQWVPIRAPVEAVDTPSQYSACDGGA